MSEVSIDAAANCLFEALEAGDLERLRSCYAPDAQIWLNTDGVPRSRDVHCQMITHFFKVVSDRKYVERRRTIFPGGFVQQHIVQARRATDGAPVQLPACIICAVEDGKITRLDEYLDSAHVAEFKK